MLQTARRHFRWGALAALLASISPGCTDGTPDTAKPSAAGTALTTTTVIPKGSRWRYLDDGSNQGSAWRSATFNDAAWKAGLSQLGYGDGDEAQVIGYGPDTNAKYITSYFRAAFSVADKAAVTGLTLNLLRDDGAVVYLNGTEAARSNMPTGTVSSTTLATTAVVEPDESAFLPLTISVAGLLNGNNVLAIEVHQAAASSSDLSFDAELIASGEISVTRGPYLQSGSDTAAVVRWRTNVATTSRVSFGPSMDTLSVTADDSVATTEHVVRLSALQAETKYFYAVGTTSARLAGGDANHFFLTAPPPGTARPTRIWAIGDSGTAGADVRRVRDAYATFTGSRYTDVWLMLGDNAYSKGLDTEYQSTMFATFPALLRQSFLWLTIGNHETDQNANPASIPMLELSTLPTAGEAGGLASGTERYYAFNRGNVHFVCLDSMTSSRAPTAAMLTWLAQDLDANTQPWTIAFWHHPPYSKGTHNSDTETELIEMRANALPILEARGVDLVLSGHSHSYERSYLVNGHYGTSSTWSRNVHAKDASSGTPGGDGTAGAYRKGSLGKAAHEGAVYVVAGSGSELGSTTPSFGHPAMFVSLSRLGSVVIDVDGARLDAKFLRDTGVIEDSFSIIKGPLTIPMVPDAGADATVSPPAPVTLLAKGAAWRYLDNGSNQGTAWRSASFVDTSWKAGNAQFGYGDGDEKSVVSYGPNAQTKYTTTYFRTKVSIANPSAYSGIQCKLLRDDGALVFVNGTEVLRSNMPTGTISSTTLALSAVSGTNEATYFSTTLPASVFVAGQNVIAVEVHQVTGTSSDLSFDLELTGTVR